MRHNYNERKARRINCARGQAEKNRNRSKNHQKTAEQIAQATQGEPIKVGHYSEPRHRRDLEKLDRSMVQAIAAGNAAKGYEQEARAIESNTAIYSDDPDALQKLVTQLVKLEKLQVYMKTVNKQIRTGDRDGFLKFTTGSQSTWDKISETVKKGEGIFEPFQLTNNSANIRRIKARIMHMEKDRSRDTSEETVKGVRVVRNVEANRIQLIFPSVPPEKVREQLHKAFGFRCCRSEGAWQRHLNNAGEYAVKTFLEGYQPET